MHSVVQQFNGLPPEVRPLSSSAFKREIADLLIDSLRFSDLRSSCVPCRTCLRVFLHVSVFMLTFIRIAASFFLHFYIFFDRFDFVRD